MPPFSLDLTDNTRCDYEVTVSARAKYLRIKIREGKVIVVLPHGIKEKQAHEFVAGHKEWIYKHLQKMKAKPVRPIVRPLSLDFAFLGEHWKIVYLNNGASGITLEEISQDTVTIQGQVDDLEMVFKVIAQWLKAKAKSPLADLMHNLACEYGFEFGRVTIRGQKTRWGSCSSKHNMSLNYKLLFFPRDAVRYVLIHELCHTREHNHSKRFWQHVENCDPDYKEHENVLKQAESYIPAGLIR